jgi:transposase
MVASAETVTRIKDTNGYRWVFMCDQAIVHQAQQSRAELVVRE